jgi:thiol:disulfide interchange protein DsbC
MRKLFFVLLMAVAAGAVSAEPATKAIAADPRAEIAKKFPGAKAEDIQPSAIKGMFEVRLGGDVAYVSSDGRYLISGDMFDIDSRVNLTESGRSDSRRKLLAKLDEKDMIVFAPENAKESPKHTITVFTDVECGYCQKLHSEIAQINKLGVRVRYMAYPRAGPGTADWAKMESVWCSKDRKAAITQAKQGSDVKAGACATPVAKQYELGEQMGVRGTPAIYTLSGDYIGGYLPPQQLLQQLDELAKGAKK